MWFRKKTLDDVLNKTFRLKIYGVIFKVRKVNPLDYVSGSKAVQMHFDTYKTKGQKEAIAKTASDMGKVKEHYRDVFMAAVVEPTLCRKEGGEGTFVDNLFTDWDLANELYLGIMEKTYGKKKFRSITSHLRERQNSTS